MALENVMFFSNGNYAAFDVGGHQVAKEQGCAWFPVLQDKLNRGVIDEKTIISMAGWESTTVAELIKSERLKRPVSVKSPN